MRVPLLSGQVFSHFGELWPGGGSLPQLPQKSRANLPAIDGCMAEGRSGEEALKLAREIHPQRKCSSFPQYWTWNKIVEKQVQ